ncbi:putative oxidoreductase [Helianthus anomalus]
MLPLDSISTIGYLENHIQTSKDPIQMFVMTTPIVPDAGPKPSKFGSYSTLFHGLDTNFEATLQRINFGFDPGPIMVQQPSLSGIIQPIDLNVELMTHTSTTTIFANCSAPIAPLPSDLIAYDSEDVPNQSCDVMSDTLANHSLPLLQLWDLTPSPDQNVFIPVASTNLDPYCSSVALFFIYEGGLIDSTVGVAVGNGHIQQDQHAIDSISVVVAPLELNSSTLSIDIFGAIREGCHVPLLLKRLVQVASRPKLIIIGVNTNHYHFGGSDFTYGHCSYFDAELQRIDVGFDPGPNFISTSYINSIFSMLNHVGAVLFEPSNLLLEHALAVLALIVQYFAPPTHVDTYILNVSLAPTSTKLKVPLPIHVGNSSVHLDVNRLPLFLHDVLISDSITIIRGSEVLLPYTSSHLEIVLECIKWDASSHNDPHNHKPITGTAYASHTIIKLYGNELSSSSSMKIGFIRDIFLSTLGCVPGFLVEFQFSIDSVGYTFIYNILLVANGIIVLKLTFFIVGAINIFSIQESDGKVVVGGYVSFVLCAVTKNHNFDVKVQMTKHGRIGKFPLGSIDPNVPGLPFEDTQTLVHEYESRCEKVLNSKWMPKLQRWNLDNVDFITGRSHATRENAKLVVPNDMPIVSEGYNDATTKAYILVCGIVARALSNLFNGQIDRTFVLDTEFFMLDEYLINSDGKVVVDGTWTFKIHTFDTIVKQLTTQMLNHELQFNCVQSSITTYGEPPFLLPAYAHCAARATIEAGNQLCSRKGPDRFHSMIQSPFLGSNGLFTDDPIGNSFHPTFLTSTLQYVVAYLPVSRLAITHMVPTVTPFAALYGHTPLNINRYRNRIPNVHLEDKVYLKGGSIVMNHINWPNSHSLIKEAQQDNGYLATQFRKPSKLMGV